MADKELLAHVMDCIQELANTFLNKKERVSYEKEDDFHFDLYGLLNHRKEIFWKEKSVKANTKRGFDLEIYDPYGRDGESPSIVIEIKYGHAYASKKNKKKFKKYIQKDVIKASTYDFLKLIYSKDKLSKKIFLYFGDKGGSEDLKKVELILKDNLKLASQWQTDVECILVHTASDRILDNKDIENC